MILGKFDCSKIDFDKYDNAKIEFEKTVLAEFHTLHSELVAYFRDTVDHLIADAMRSDGDDGDLERPQIGR